MLLERKVLGAFLAFCLLKALKTAILRRFFLLTRVKR